MNFYSCIIGTELLNGRRSDAHFSFLNAQLTQRGWEQKASFVIKDEPSFIADVFRLILKDENSVMFCFGGIGATPDDYTREVAAEVFTNAKMQLHEEAKRLIVERFGEDAYPNRIKMAMLPLGADLIDNPVNNVPGFSLKRRFFFLPGFVQMAHPMVLDVLRRLYPQNRQKFSFTFTAMCSEEALIFAMQQLPKSVEFSSLPIIDGEKRVVELYVASFDAKEALDCRDLLMNAARSKCISVIDGGYFSSLS